MPKPNDNQGIEEEEIDETPAEGEEEEIDDEEIQEEEEESEEEKEEEEEEDDQEAKAKAEAMEKAMAKFKGKTAEEIIEMYQNLEQTMPGKIAKEAAKQALILLKKNNGQRPEGNGKTDKEITDEIEKTDFSKMDPKEFARWVLAQIDSRAVKKAQEIYDSSNQVRGAVAKEIRMATKSHPHLKDNTEYREIVISLIEVAASRGETLSLKKACEKADKAMNIKVAEKSKEVVPPVKKKNTGVEKPSGTDAAKNDSEEDKVKKGMLGSGSGPNPLGGLGL